MTIECFARYASITLVTDVSEAMDYFGTLSCTLYHELFHVVDATGSDSDNGRKLEPFSHPSSELTLLCSLWL